jgi:hypothetical protein
MKSLLECYRPGCCSAVQPRTASQTVKHQSLVFCTRPKLGHVLNIVIPSQSSIVASLLAQAHVRRRRRCLTADRPRAPVPFIVGSRGSGIGLLRSMLDAHPQLAIPPETGFLPRALGALFGNDQRQRHSFLETLFPDQAGRWSDFGIGQDAFMRELEGITPFRLDEALRCFYQMYAARFGKGRWGDRTSSYGKHMRVIEQVLPEACFIHIVRDGRDVAASLRDRASSPGADMAALARQWRRDIRAIRHQSLGVRHYLELRYEYLVLDTETCLKDICDFIAIDYLPTLKRGLRPADSASLFRWRQTLSIRQKNEYEAVAGGLLTALDYSPAVLEPETPGR